MRTFIGTKIVKALPMTRLAYNEFRGWTLPADEDGTDEGYLVEYTDGGKPNTEKYAGYVSWSPKQQFDDAYIYVPSTENLPEHMVRVAGEKSELDSKLNKLRKFIETDFFKSLPENKRDLLKTQQVLMTNYSSILSLRLNA